MRGHVNRSNGSEALMNGNSEKFEFVGPWMKSLNGAKEQTIRYYIGLRK
jgi:hypothetical protein